MPILTDRENAGCRVGVRAHDPRFSDLRGAAVGCPKASRKVCATRATAGAARRHAADVEGGRLNSWYPTRALLRGCETNERTTNDERSSSSGTATKKGVLRFDADFDGIAVLNNVDHRLNRHVLSCLDHTILLCQVTYFEVLLYT